MSLRLLKYLSDARRAIGLLRTFTADKCYEDYLHDSLLRSAIERQFEILGEALNHAAVEDAELDQKISDLRRIVSFRNFLIHGYDAVDDEIVWAALEKLNLLEQEISFILNNG
jgi:uncharacterized protein with HEPN domain